MGYEDRDYYQDSYADNYRGNSWNGGSSFSGAGRSAVITLIIINVVVFLLDAFTPVVAEGKTQWLADFLSLDSERLWKVWGLITHGFTHASLIDSDHGIAHILFNMIGLLVFGISVEQRLGKQEFLRFYLAGVLLSGLVWLIYTLVVRGAGPSLVGASGAVSAVTFYFIFMSPRATLLLMGIIPCPAWLLGGIFFVGNLMYAIDPLSPIAWQAHFAGAAFGALYFRMNWNLGRFDFGMSNLFSNRAKLKIHDPDAKDEKLKSQADAILEKIHREGESSLTRKERKILDRYSAKIRDERNP